jgi:HEAT repeat protein
LFPCLYLLSTSPLSNLFSGDDARAEAALAHITADYLPDLQAALLGHDAEARWWAVRALAALAHQPDSPAIALLLTSTADPDAEVRAAVFQALGEAKIAEAITPLLFALSDSSPYLARLAADALIRIGPPAVPGLIRALQNDAEARVRVNAARALTQIGDPSAIPALFRALEDESPLVQHWADEGLERLGVGQVYFQV